MQLHNKTINKIKQLFEMSEIFCEQQLIQHETEPDFLFIINSFEKISTDLKFKILMNNNYTIRLYHEDIFNFDSIISNWRDNLSFCIEKDSNKNDLYSVLFSILQCIETIMEEDYLNFEEDNPVETNKEN
jgi:hypothetical protein